MAFEETGRGTLGRNFLHSGSLESFYSVGRELGQGSFATVRSVTCEKDQTKWAAKCIDKKNLSAEDEKALDTEVEILGSLDHRNIVHLRECFDSKKTFYMVLENCAGGEMFDRIVEKEKYSEHEARVAFFQIITALDYCHGKGVVHRDLKPENLLYSDGTEDAALKIADFGLARLFSDEKHMEMMTTMCGTPGYVAPEILKGLKYDSSVDIWSAGVILYILLCGYPPFYEQNNAALFRQIKSGSFDYPAAQWESISQSAKDLIDGMIIVDPAKRWSTKQILESPWMQVEDLGAKSLDHVIPFMKKFNARRKFKAGAMLALTAVGVQRKMKK